MATAALRAGKAFLEFSIKDGKINDQLRKLERKFAAVGGAFKTFGAIGSAAGAAMLGPLAAAVKQSAALGDSLHKMSARTGFGVEALSELGFAAEQSGTDLNTLETGIKGMQKVLLNADQGLKSATDNLQEIGLTMADLKNKTPEEQFKLIADRIAGVEDPTKKAALAMKLFGGSGQKLIPLLSSGADGMEALRKEARELGIVVSTDSAEDAAAFADQWNRMTKVFKSATLAVGDALIPHITELSAAVTESLKTVADWAKRNGEAIVTTAKWAAGLLAAGVSITVVGNAVTAFSAILGAMRVGLAATTKVFAAMRVAMNFLIAHPAIAALGAIVVAAGAVAVAMGHATRSMREHTAAATAMIAKGDELRKTDQLRLERLKQLAEKESLNSAEMDRASELIGILEDQYGDLGLSIDSTTGAITGLTNAQKKMNDEMRKGALNALALEADALNREMDILFDKSTGFAADQAKYTGIGTTAEEYGIQIDKLNAKLAKNYNRRKALQAGDQEAITGPAKSTNQKLQDEIDKGNSAPSVPPIIPTATPTPTDDMTAPLFEKFAKGMKSASQAFNAGTATTIAATQQGVIAIDRAMAAGRAASEGLRVAQNKVSTGSISNVAALQSLQGPNESTQTQILKSNNRIAQSLERIERHKTKLVFGGG